MKKYLWMSSAAVVIGTLRVDVAKEALHEQVKTLASCSDLVKASTVALWALPTWNIFN